MAETSGTSDVSALIKQFESLTNDVPKDESVRKQLFEAARSLTFALESPGDTIQRICYLVKSDYGLVDIALHEDWC